MSKLFGKLIGVKSKSATLYYYEVCKRNEACVSNYATYYYYPSNGSTSFAHCGC